MVGGSGEGGLSMLAGGVGGRGSCRGTQRCREVSLSGAGYVEVSSAKGGDRAGAVLRGSGRGFQFGDNN